jgi:hypothetical protein
MDHLDSFTYRNASSGGQILDTYGVNDVRRIRAVLLDYNAENNLSVESLFKRLCAAERGSDNVGFSFKTFQRFLAGSRQTRAETVAVCARFAKGLPNRPHAFHALGEALAALYKMPLPPDIAGTYTLASSEGFSTELSIATPSAGFALVTEKHTVPSRRLHDGVLVSSAHDEYFVLSRDRLMLKPRYITIFIDIAFVCDRAAQRYPGEKAVDYVATFMRATE